jgi:hypothetical protein
MEWMATITGDHVGYPGGHFGKNRAKLVGVKNAQYFLLYLKTH